MAHFFIDRPIFAWVIAILIMVAGGLAASRLGIERYPSIAPPQIQVNAMYPGASATVLEDSVTQIIEQSMKGLDGLIYMSATSQANGQATLNLSFQNGVNPDIAQVQVQNKLQVAMPLLPQEVQRQGVTVTKGSSSFLMVVGFISQDGSMTRDDIADYITTNLVDPLSRVEGVGQVRVFGSKYAMRIWLDPNKLDTYRLTIAEVIAAIQAQNAQVTVGQLGGTPAVPGQQLNATIMANQRLQTPDQFREIVVRSNRDGSVLKLSDIARVEVGSENYEVISRFNGKPATGVGISLATNANALATARAVEAKVKEFQPNFPAGLSTAVPFDTTPFVRASIKSVVETLLEAVVLVFLVMYLFLQNLRATIIPTIAVPVVLLGTFGILAVLGFTINMLTMFAMVLAIGLLVDDAIVVVENVERLMTEEGLSPKEAAHKSMDQITGALVGIGLVLSAVFIPMAFLGGATGVIYRQFSGTIVAAMGLSVLVAIVLTPALCATMLKPLHKGEHYGTRGFFGWFNRNFDRTGRWYQVGVRGILARPFLFFTVFLALVGAMVMLFLRLPSAFLPPEDQGILFALVQTPPGATQQRTLASIEQIERYFLEKETQAVESLFGIQGFSFSGSGQNAGLAFIKLKDWEQRPGPTLSAGAVAGRAMGAMMQMKDARAFAFPPPPVPELGQANGYAFFLKDTIGLGHEALLAARNQLLGAAAQSKLLANVRPNGLEDTPQMRLKVDVKKAAALGVSIATINSTLATAWGGSYIDDYLDRGRVKRVYLQADAPFRMAPEDFNRWSVRNSVGEMTPISAIANATWEYGSPRLERYNGVPAMEMNGEAKPGISTGEAMAEVERLVTQLPPGIGIEWTGVSYQERAAGAQAPLLYALSFLVVFLCLAALYESWSIPTAVLMVAPLGVLGAVAATWLRGMERDVYFQVAMLTTVGLTSKNAILIIEFAKANLESGMDLIESIMNAVRDRMRPIVMTSLAFGLGVLPLAIAVGAGSGTQRAIGTGVMGGMVAGTLLGMFFTPLFFLVIQRLFGRRKKPVADANGPEAQPALGAPSHA
jgi:multidrug efflux pump